MTHNRYKDSDFDAKTRRSAKAAKSLGRCRLGLASFALLRAFALSPKAFCSLLWLGAGMAGFSASLAAYDLRAVGGNNAGQLGDGTNTDRSSPVLVAEEVVSIAASRYTCGVHFSLFLKADGTLWATGKNASGQLGDGTNADRTSPVQVATGVASVAAGSFHTLFVKTDGSLWGMGDNFFGQLGDGSTTDRNSSVLVATGVASVSAGASHTLFVKTDGSLWAMGGNAFGQLGNCGRDGHTSPVQIATNVLSASAGAYHSLFVKTDGSLWGTGDNSYGQLGNDGSESYLSPVQVTTGVSVVSAGARHSLFVKRDGTLWAVGDNHYGQLGDGTTESRVSPVQITTNVASVSAGVSHSLFVKSDGTLWAMGNNTSWQFGANRSGEYYTPTQVTNKALMATSGDTHSFFLVEKNVLTTAPFGRPALTWGSIGAIPEGTPLSETELNAQAGIPGTFVYSPAIGTILEEGTHALNVTFMPDDSARYAIASASNQIEITEAVLMSFSLWQQGFFTESELQDPAISGPDADPDGDGMGNFLEYALGYDPKQASAQSALEVGATEAEWIYTFKHPVDRGALSYQVEMSGDLGTWILCEVAPQKIGESEGVETWQVAVPRTGDRIFFRLKVTQ